MIKFSKYLFLCAGIISSSNIYATNEITITGNVLDSTCTLSSSNAAGPTNAAGDFTIVLPNVLTSDFVNGIAGETDVIFRLTKGNGSTENCDLLTGGALLQSLYFTASQVNTDLGAEGVLINTNFTGESTDSRVDVQFLTEDGLPIDFNATPQMQNKPVVTGTDGSAIITNKLRYIQAGEKIEAQRVEAKMTYTFNYN